jgi:alpha-tubulin suppressor-like RCC1 family protein
VPVQIANLAGVIAIAAGRDHSLALDSTGGVWAWGDNSGSQLGDGTTVASTVPVQVSNLSGAIAIAGGGRHSLAIVKR